MQNMIRRLVLNLALLSLLVLNISPIAIAMDETPSAKNNSERLSTSALLETLEKVEEDEIIASLDFNGYALNAHRFGYALKDQFAIPNERGYLPDEPPIS